MSAHNAAATDRTRRRPRAWKKGRDPGSKMVAQRIEDAGALVSAVAVYKDQVAAGLAEKLLPRLRGAAETLPDHAFALELVARSVEGTLEELLEVHEQYVRQTARCNRSSERCDRLAVDELYPRAVGLRRSIDAVFGKPAGESIHGFSGRIPTWRDGLRDQVARALHFLENPRAELPAPRETGFIADREAWIRQLRPPYERLVASSTSSPRKTSRARCCATLGGRRCGRSTPSSAGRAPWPRRCSPSPGVRNVCARSCGHATSAACCGAGRGDAGSCGGRPGVGWRLGSRPAPGPEERLGG